MSLLIFILLCFYPISYGVIRLAILILAGVIYISCLYLRWRSKTLRIVLVTLLSIAFLFFFLPGKAVNPDSLRTKYLSQLIKYEDTHYLWGGENKIGIDCSGLVRKGLITASFQEGLFNFNPYLIRTSFDLWWNDSSAEALRDEYRVKSCVIKTTIARSKELFS